MFTRLPSPLRGRIQVEGATASFPLTPLLSPIRPRETHGVVSPPEGLDILYYLPDFEKILDSFFSI
jgi:hypothetical protein